MKILISGASGLIGKNFVRHALRQGDTVSAIVRRPEAFRMLPENHIFKWNHEALVPSEALEEINAVVHLSGENIADRSWTKEQKKRLVDSRILGAQNLIASLAKVSPKKRPKVLISGSAIGYYGYKREGEIVESATPGDDFLANLCRDWEAEAMKAEKLGIRVVLLRTGIVLSKEGGALLKMPPIQISNGKSWMSWIHVQDVVKIISYVLKNENVAGAVNCVAPNPVTNKEFTKALARSRGIPSFGMVPRSFLKIALGELSNAILSSLQVKPHVLIDSGFCFSYPNLEQALDAEFKGHSIFDSFLFKDQFVPMKPEELFQFFSRAENLETLTPPWLNFKIVSKSSEEINKGSIIDYKLKIHGIPVYWKTRIVDWKRNEFFIDEQKRGPYSKWHHVHTFEPVTGGCLLRDEVTYRVPAAFIGNLLLGRWISKDVDQIFKYRQEKIHSLLKSGELV